MKTKLATNQYLVNFARKKVKVSTVHEKKLTFFELASKTIANSKTGAYTTASREVDDIAYGTK